MNAQLARQMQIVELYRELRDQLIDTLTGDDLAMTPGGDAPGLGILFRELGETQSAYIESFKTFEFGPAEPCPIEGLANSFDKIRAWYTQLDTDLSAVLESVGDDEGERPVDRGGGNQLPAWIHLDVFREALIIFYGKVSVYLKAAGRPRPQRFEHWIG